MLALERRATVHETGAGGAVEVKISTFWWRDPYIEFEYGAELARRLPL